MINEFEKLLPVLPFLIGSERLCVWATDEEKYIYFEDKADLQTDVNVGSLLKPEDTAIEAMKTGKAITRVVSKEVFGIALKTYVVPVSGGCIGVTYKEDERLEVIDAIQTLSKSSNEVFSGVMDLTESVSKIKLQLESVQQYALQTQSFHDQLTDIINTILHIVDELQLLSLNAILEATKAGDEGRTFTVVADEIKKLASVGESQVKDIEVALQLIVSALDDMQSKVSSMQAVSDDLVGSSNSLEDHFNEVAITVNDLNKVKEHLR